MHIFINIDNNINKKKNKMKKVEKQKKYTLKSGDEEIITSTNIQSLCDYIGCSFAWVYANKNKDINKDGTWSFNFKGYNYTILKTI